MVRRIFAASLEQVCLSRPAELKVVRQAAARFFDVGRGLVEGQWQTVHLLNKLPGFCNIGWGRALKMGIEIEQARAMEEEERALLRRHFFQRHRLGNAAGGL